MRIGDTSCTSFGRGTAHHEACEVHHGLVAALLLLLVLREAFLQELVNDKMYDGFTDAPPGSCYALPEPPDTLKQQNLRYVGNDFFPYISGLHTGTVHSVFPCLKNVFLL